MDYNDLTPKVELLDGKKDGCNNSDGEFKTSVKIPSDKADDEKAKSLGFLFIKKVKGKMSKDDTKEIDLSWYGQCNMITQTDMLTFHDSLSIEEKFDIIKKAHIVNYQEVIKNDFLVGMGYQKPTKANDKAKVLAGKIIYSKKDKIIESLMKGGMSKKEATKEYDENIAM